VVWQVTPSPFHAFHVPLPPLCTVVVDDVCKRAVVVVVVVDVADKKPVLVVADALPLHAGVQVDFALQ